MTAKLYDKLVDYSKNGRYPFHMPGHKMGRGIDIKDVFAMDITEIDGFDNLHNPTDIIKQAQEDYAALFGAKHTFFAVNGATGALQAAIMAICGPDDKVIMARNCHRSVYSAMILTGARTVYVMPQYCGVSDLPGGITPESVEEAVNENPDAKAIIITSPTAEGDVSDIRKIAEIAHKNNMVLIADEAHGAHFMFSHSFPETALEMGADIVVQSAHKTLPCPTQSSVIHIGGNMVDSEKVREALSIIETSSPSYVFMGTLDWCREYLEKEGRKIYPEFTDFLINERKRLSVLKNMRLLDKDVCGKYGIKDIDVSKIVISSQNVNCVEISQILRQKYNMEMEMGCHGHFMAICTISDEKEKIKDLINAIIEIDKHIVPNKSQKHNLKFTSLNRVVSLRNAYYSKAEDVPYNEAAGRVSAEFLIPYPPGIPAVSPGELITEEALENIRLLYESGVEITGVKYQGLEKLRVLS